MTAREEAFEVLKRIWKNFNTAKVDIDRLSAIVGEQQNGPPEGVADGSLTETQWTALKYTTKALSTALLGIRMAGELLKKI